MHILDTLRRTLDGLRRSASRRVEMELCLLTLCNSELDSSNAALLRRVAALESRLKAAHSRRQEPAPAPVRAPKQRIEAEPETHVISTPPVTELKQPGSAPSLKTYRTTRSLPAGPKCLKASLHLTPRSEGFLSVLARLCTANSCLSIPQTPCRADTPCRAPETTIGSGAPCDWQAL